MNIHHYLKSGQIEHVIVGGENYNGARPLHFDWVEALYSSCVEQPVNFEFIETGNHFIKDGNDYRLPKWLQIEQTKKSSLEYLGRAVKAVLTDAPLNESLPLFGMEARSLCDSWTYKNKCSIIEKIGCQLRI